MHAAEAGHHQGAEQRVVHDAGHEFHLSADHRLDQRPALRPTCGGDCSIGDAHRRGVDQVELDTARVALVHQVRVGRLEHDRVADALRREDRVVLAAGGDGGDQRDAVAGEDGGRALVRLPAGTRGQPLRDGGADGSGVDVGQGGSGAERLPPPGGVPGGVPERPHRPFGQVEDRRAPRAEGRLRLRQADDDGGDGQAGMGVDHRGDRRQGRRHVVGAGGGDHHEQGVDLPADRQRFHRLGECRGCGRGAQVEGAVMAGRVRGDACQPLAKPRAQRRHA